MAKLVDLLIVSLQILVFWPSADGRIPDLGVVSSMAKDLDSRLKTFLDGASGIETLQKDYISHKENITFAPIDGAELVETLARELGAVLGKKMAALNKSVMFAEELAAEYEWNSDLELGDVNYTKAKAINESDPDYEYNETFNQKVNFNTSSVHIPVEIYEGDIEILNGLEWTSRLDEVWTKNREEDPGLLWQYFGSQTGIMRNFPASKWKGEGVDLYDVRRRPWYTQGASSPKDMLILVDTSGSTHGQALALMKQSVVSLLDTLGENDFVNVAHFAEEAEWVGCFQSFVQANYRNKKELAQYVDAMKAGGMASYHKGFEFAFQKFEEFEQNKENRTDGEGANCNRIIMFLTDGGTEMPEEVFNRYNRPVPFNASDSDSIKKDGNETDGKDFDMEDGNSTQLDPQDMQIRIFSYGVGPTATPLVAVKWIACTNRGFFYRIPAMGAIRSTVQDHYKYIGLGLAGNESRQTHWSRLYDDLWVKLKMF